MGVTYFQARVAPGQEQLKPLLLILVFFDSYYGSYCTSSCLRFRVKLMLTPNEGGTKRITYISPPPTPR